jgi:hypothetical protein
VFFRAGLAGAFFVEGPVAMVGWAAEATVSIDSPENGANSLVGGPRGPYYPVEPSRGRRDTYGMRGEVRCN